MKGMAEDIKVIVSSQSTLKRALLRYRRSLRRRAALAPHNLAKTATLLVSDQYILAEWWDVTSNWGDALNPYLIQRISGRPVVHRRKVFDAHERPVYLVVGSILGIYEDPNQVVWGSGLLRPSRRLSTPPAEIKAVRGPLTRQALIDQGIPCPDVFGDPALLLPRFYQPSVVKSYRLGFIPHYKERDHPAVKQISAEKGVRYIDICGPIEDVVDQICSCEVIASSSLHGIIAADAYGIPSLWFSFSELDEEGTFKYRDYHRSVGRKDDSPLVVTEKTSVHDILQSVVDYEIDIDLDRLYDACPFTST